MLFFLANSTPTDSKNDNGKNADDKDGHFSTRNANGHVADKGSKSTCKVYGGRMLAVAVVVGIIAIVFLYVPGLKFPYEGTCTCNASSYYYFSVYCNMEYICACLGTFLSRLCMSKVWVVNVLLDIIINFH